MNRPLISTEWLAANLASLRVVDGSWHMPADNRDGAAEFVAARIPGAIAVDLKAPLPTLDAQALESDIVVYCACPNEVSAALLASRLRAAGYP